MPVKLIVFPEFVRAAPFDVAALRHERAVRRGHSMLAHRRTEAYPVYQKHIYPPRLEKDDDEMLSYEKNNALIDESKHLIDSEFGESY